MARLSTSYLVVTFAILLSLVSAIQGEVLPAGEEIGTASSSFKPEPVQLSSDTLSHLAHPRIPTSKGQLVDRPHSARSKFFKRRHESKQNKVKSSGSSGGYIGNGQMTYYYGTQLLNPACPNASTPSDASMTAAISNDSPFQCGDQIKIANKNGKQVTVTVVDRCEGCSSDHLDVTKAVFEKFSSLEMGVLYDMSFSKI
ncbi:uncharacterized protein MEPE_05086 [Melanopsichium pennsylvanicum]|uniref:RlpA-like protein double-psi beta-barrel domain-containing protein n=1 Tax=Melanopsichium pennsylvanicum TaxID=63383 RepID=A0AAJ4XQ59_9BASI|nr:uncharacterized protein MEPE_05086 [Melanopsichium pennsylvanicum]